MAGTALRGRLTWQLAELVNAVAETPRVKTIVFDVPGWPGHRAGQHVDVRLTAEDGYQAERSYSIASAPVGTRVALTVQRLQDGEVSPYLTGELRPGDKIELRGPIGGYFVWEPSGGGPLMLVAGGSGIVPLMAMIRTRAAAGDDTETRLLYSSRSQDDVIYRGELERLSGNGLTVVHALTDSQPPGWTSYAPCRRRDARRGFAFAGRAAAFVRVRTDAVRRGGGRIARAARTRHAGDQDRTLWSHRTVTWAS
jgi:ferredoxin-NADP reductase